MRTLVRFRSSMMAVALASGALGSVTAAEAATLAVGPGKAYATPCAAIAAAHPGDEVDVASGTYTDSCEINVQGLTVRGASPLPVIDLSGTNHPADLKGIYVIAADDVRIENLELRGAHVDDSAGGNAAALRVTGQGVVVHGCAIHDNQNGILAGPTKDGGTITIENTELSHNGLGDGCDQAGCTHNVYISKTDAIRYDKAIFQFNWSHDLASDTANKGHLLKSRARETDVLYNRITGEGGHDSYEVDLPNAGLGIVVGNVIEKGPSADNSTLLDYGEEGLDPGQATTLYAAFNTFVNDFTGGTFIRIAPGTTLTAHDNLFVGPGALASSGALSADNLTAAAAAFVDAAGYDYHLVAGASPVGKAVAAGAAGSFSLTPRFEYLHPLGSASRSLASDVGAFAYGTAHASPSDDAGAAAGDASAPADAGGTSVPAGGNGGAPGIVRPGDGGASLAGDADSDATAPSSDAGCGCLLSGSRPRPGVALLGATAWLGLALRRRSRRRSAEQ